MGASVNGVVQGDAGEMQGDRTEIACMHGDRMEIVGESWSLLLLTQTCCHDQGDVCTARDRLERIKWALTTNEFHIDKHRSVLKLKR